jgi:hypothetical protein
MINSLTKTVKKMEEKMERKVSKKRHIQIIFPVSIYFCQLK